MITKKLYIFSFLIAITFSCSNKRADLVVINSKIYTVDNNNSIANSIAIKDGKIIEVSNKNLNDFYETKNIFDAEGKTILPGLIDSHCHFYNLGLGQEIINLRGTKSLDDILKILKDYDSKNNSKTIIGRGWDQNDWDDKTFPKNDK